MINNTGTTGGKSLKDYLLNIMTIIGIILGAKIVAPIRSAKAEDDCTIGVNTFAECIPDATLAGIVSKTANVDKSTVMTQNLVNSVTIINESYTNVSSLEGLQVFTNLQELSLSNSNVTDITPVVHLPNMNTLELNNNKITTLPSGWGMPKLKTLWLSGNKITDASNIKSLPELTSVVLSNNTGIASLPSFADTPNLEEVYLVNDPALKTISPLANHAKLRILSLSYSNITSIAPVSSAVLPNLQQLLLDNDPSFNGDLSPLKNSTSMQVLTATTSKTVKDITSLSGLTKMTTLELNNNIIEDISPLKSMTNLKNLDLSYNSIKDISSLPQFTSISQLNLSDNKIEDVSHLKNINMPSITNLRLSDNSIMDISSLTDILKTNELYNSEADQTITRPSINIQVDKTGNMTTTIPVPQSVDGPVAPASLPDYAKYDTNKKAITLDYTKWKSYDSKPFTFTYKFSTKTPEGFDFTGTVTQPFTVGLTASFVTNSDDTIPDQQVQYGKPVIKPVTNPSKDCETFIFWSTDTTNHPGIQPYSFTTPLEQNITLYAIWSLVGFTVDFDSQGGSSADSQYVNCGDKVTEPTTTRDGYVFKGWYTQSVGGEKFDFNKPLDDPTHEYKSTTIKLYAQWAQIHKITFDTAGGSAQGAILVPDGEKATRPKDPTRDGYTFKGWYTDTDRKNLYDFNQPVTKDMILYAKWNMNLETLPVTGTPVSKTWFYALTTLVTSIIGLAILLARSRRRSH